MRMSVLYNTIHPSGYPMQHLTGAGWAFLMFINRCYR